MFYLLAKPIAVQHLRPVWMQELIAGFKPNLEQVSGRISSARTAGSKLVFIDILDHAEDERLQVVVNNGQLEDHDRSVNRVKAFGRLIRRGDIICQHDPAPRCTLTD